MRGIYPTTSQGFWRELFFGFRDACEGLTKDDRPRAASPSRSTPHPIFAARVSLLEFLRALYLVVFRGCLDDKVTYYCCYDCC